LGTSHWFPGCRQIEYKPDESPGLRLTGNDMIDYGLQTIVVNSNKSSPEELVYADLDQFAEILEETLLAKGLTGQISVYYTMNFGAINPAWVKAPEKKASFVREVSHAYSYRPETAREACIYCDRPSIIRGYRHLIPMLTGEGVVNFYPHGDSGYPICGFCLFAVMALAVGAQYIYGRMLFIGCNNQELVQDFIREWMQGFLPRLQMAKTGDGPDKLGNPLTRVAEVVFDIDLKKENIKALTERSDLQELDVRIYHLSNSGQGPMADIYYLPMSVVYFARRAQRKYPSLWNELKKRGQSLSKNSTNRKNYFYESLFLLPEEGPYFIRTYFLRRALGRSGYKEDPRRNYNSLLEADLLSWGLVELFLKEVTGMEEQRVNALRLLGETVANYIMETDDKTMFEKVYRARRYWEIRMLLIKMSRSQVLRGKPPVISFDDFITVFEEGEEAPKIDWRLAWDLVIIRVIETLYQNKWLQKHQKELLESEELEELEEEEEL